MFGVINVGAACENGLAEGCVEGALDKALETARNMKADGLAPETITKYTGLTSEQIAES